MRASLVDSAGSRIERHLMRRAIHDARIAPENVLRSIAVMHVPIDDRHTLSAVNGLGMARADRRLIEEAKSHRGRAFCMVSRRAHGDEGIVDLATHDLIDS